MTKLNITINILNVSFSVINVILATILQFEKISFNSKTETTLIRYRYFENVLLEPYFKLIVTSLFYDIIFYSATYLLSKYFFKVSTEKNEENIRTKSIQENMISNIMVEFLFMTMIKGIALGFGIFYVIELDKEIKRIIKMRDINENQENVLNSMLSTVNINGVFNFITLIYQFLFYGIRLFIACKSNTKYYKNESPLETEKKDKVMKRVNSSGNISLPETHEDEGNYEKLDKN